MGVLALTTADVTTGSIGFTTLLMGLALGWAGRPVLARALARVWFWPVVWVLGLAVAIAATAVALSEAQRLSEADEAYAAQVIAAGMLLVISFLVFSAGRQRSIATDDITWEEDGPATLVEKGETVTKAVRDLPGVAAKLNTKLMATKDIKYQEAGKTVSVKKGELLPAGAENVAGVGKTMYREVYVAKRAFTYRPTVKHTVKAGETLSGADARRPEAAGKTDTTRGLSFRALVVGKDGRWSTSKLQALLWTYAVLFGLLSLYLASVGLGVDLFQEVDGNETKVPFEKLGLPDAYYLLLGGPFAAAILAKALTASKVASGDVVKPTTTGTSGPVDGLSEIVSDDAGNTDLVDTQYFLFNLLVLVYFFVSFIPSLKDGFPEVPEVLLGLTSASALAYVTNKAVERDTPSVSSVAPLTVSPGGKVEVWGENLVGTNTAPPQVQIGGLRAKSVEVLGGGPKGTDHLCVGVPDGLSGSVELVVTPVGGKPSAGVDLTVQRLSVTAVEPTVVKLRTGASLLITGVGFAEQPVDNEVTLGAKPVDVATAAPTKLSVLLKANAAYPDGDAVMLKVTVGEQSDAKAVKVIALEISEVRPALVPLEEDQQLTVIGYGFAGKPIVTLDGVRLKVMSVTERQLVCRLRKDLLDAHKYTVRVGAVLQVSQPPYTAQATVDVVTSG